MSPPQVSHSKPVLLKGDVTCLHAWWQSTKVAGDMRYQEGLREPGLFSFRKAKGRSSGLLELPQGARWRRQHQTCGGCTRAGQEAMTRSWNTRNSGIRQVYLTTGWSNTGTSCKRCCGNDPWRYSKLDWTSQPGRFQPTSFHVHATQHLYSSRWKSLFKQMCVFICQSWFFLT